MNSSPNVARELNVRRLSGRPGLSPRTRRLAAPPDITIKVLGAAAVFGIWRVQELIPGAAPLKLPLLSLAVGIALFFANRPVSALVDILKHRAIQCVIAILFLAVLGGPFALVRGPTLVFVVLDITPVWLLCLFVGAAIRCESDARWLLAAVTLGGVAFCLYSRFNSYSDSAGRPSGIIYYDANDLALLASTTAALALGLAHTAKKKSARLIWLGSAGVLLVTVLWTLSRGAFLAVSATACYLLLSPIMPVAKRVLILAVGFVGLLVVGGRSYVNQMKTMLSPEDDYNFSGESVNGRGEVWKRGMQYVWQRPIMGAGVRNYTAAENRSDYARDAMQSNRGFKLSRAHNSYLEIAVELGLPGFLLFSLALMESLRRLHVRARKKRPPLDDSAKMNVYIAASLSGFIVGAFFLSAEYFALIYMIIGVAAALTSMTFTNSSISVASKGSRGNVMRSRRFSATPVAGVVGMASR